MGAREIKINNVLPVRPLRGQGDLRIVIREWKDRKYLLGPISHRLVADAYYRLLSHHAP